MQTVGFGLSEKVNDITIHTPEFHATLFVKLIEALGVQKFTVVGQDWGGPIAALVAARMKDRLDPSRDFCSQKIYSTKQYIYYFYVAFMAILVKFPNFVIQEIDQRFSIMT